MMGKIIVFLTFLIFTGTNLSSQGFELYEPIAQYAADKGTIDRKYTIRQSAWGDFTPIKYPSHASRTSLHSAFDFLPYIL